MQLSEIIDQLAHGELSQLRLAEDGEIKEKDYPRIINLINTGLTALYTRFPLKLNHAEIVLEEGRTHYTISSDHLLSSRQNRNTPRYINDLEKPFEDDLLRIVSVSTLEGKEFRLNDENDPWAITTYSMNSIVVPKLLVNPQDNRSDAKYKSDGLIVKYRARHPKITIRLGYFDPKRVYLELPCTHLQALLFYVASRAHSPVGLAEEGLVGSGYFAKYENECRILEFHNATMDTQTSTLLPKHKGFI